MKEHRYACQRQHRVLGHFLAIQAWLKGVDCLVLEREDLECFLGLKRFKQERVSWLKEDLRPWFPYCSEIEQIGSGYSLHSIWISRVEISKWMPSGDHDTLGRLKLMKRGAPRAAPVTDGAFGYRSLNEQAVIKYLALLDSGITDPKPICEELP